jgi:hypothetical protein
LVRNVTRFLVLDDTSWQEAPLEVVAESLQGFEARLKGLETVSCLAPPSCERGRAGA